MGVQIAGLLNSISNYGQSRSDKARREEERRLQEMERRGNTGAMVGTIAGSYFGPAGAAIGGALGRKITGGAANGSDAAAIANAVSVQQQASERESLMAGQKLANQQQNELILAGVNNENQAFQDQYVQDQTQEIIAGSKPASGFLPALKQETDPSLDTSSAFGIIPRGENNLAGVRPPVGNFAQKVSVDLSQAQNPEVIAGDRFKQDFPDIAAQIDLLNDPKFLETADPRFTRSFAENSQARKAGAQNRTIKKELANEFSSIISNKELKPQEKFQNLSALELRAAQELGDDKFVGSLNKQIQPYRDRFIQREKKLSGGDILTQEDVDRYVAANPQLDGLIEAGISRKQAVDLNSIQQSRGKEEAKKVRDYSNDFESKKVVKEWIATTQAYETINGLANQKVTRKDRHLRDLALIKESVRVQDVGSTISITETGDVVTTGSVDKQLLNYAERLANGGRLTDEEVKGLQNNAKTFLDSRRKAYKIVRDTHISKGEELGISRKILERITLPENFVKKDVSVQKENLDGGKLEKVGGFDVVFREKGFSGLNLNPKEAPKVQSYFKGDKKVFTLNSDKFNTIKEIKDFKEKIERQGGTVAWLKKPN